MMILGTPQLGRPGRYGQKPAWMLPARSNGFHASGLYGAADIQTLQNTLVAYAQATGDMNANPVVNTGELNDATVVAALYVAWKAAGKVPGLKQIKNDIIGNIPLAGTVIGWIMGSGIGLTVAWNAVDAAVPGAAGVKADIRNFIKNNATAIALGISIATGTGTPGLPIPPQSQQMAPIMARFTASNQTLPKVAAYDPRKGGYRVAIAKGLSAVSATHQEIAIAQSPPSDATIITLDEFKKLVGDSSWYTNPYVIGGGLLGLTGIGFAVKYLFFK